MRSTKASAVTSLPMMIAPGRNGVVMSRSSVCFSRSRLICPAVNAGAIIETRTTWNTESTEKID